MAQGRDDQSLHGIGIAMQDRDAAVTALHEGLKP